jgi:multiple sugar transport system permease protein
MTVFPTIYLIYLSLLDYNILDGPPTFIGLRNFIQILSPDSGVLHSFLFTFGFAVTAVLIELVLGIGVALLVARKNVLAKVTTAILIITLVMPPVVSDMTWGYLYNPALGSFSYLAALAGINNLTFLEVWPNVLYSLILVDIWQWTPFVALILAAGITSLPVSPYDAAIVDGANAVNIFRYITLPLLRPVMWIVTIFRFVDALKVFNKIYLLTRGGPGDATDSVSYHIYYHSIGFTGDIGLGASISLVFLISVLTVSVIMLMAYQRSG